MKFIMKSQTDMTGAYCYGCGTQCQNKCGTQTVSTRMTADVELVTASSGTVSAVRR